jgi:hypothetical protein
MIRSGCTFRDPGLAAPIPAVRSGVRARHPISTSRPRPSPARPPTTDPRPGKFLFQSRPHRDGYTPGGQYAGCGPTDGDYQSSARRIVFDADGYQGSCRNWSEEPVTSHVAGLCRAEPSCVRRSHRPWPRRKPRCVGPNHASGRQQGSDERPKTPNWPGTSRITMGDGGPLGGQGPRPPSRLTSASRWQVRRRSRTHLESTRSASERH